MGTLNITVIVDRWEGPEDATAGAADKPLTHASTEGSRGRSRGSAQQARHQATLHVLDGSLKSLHALSRNDCDLVFNLMESFAGNDTADYCIAAYLELIEKRFTGSGSHGLLYAQDKGVAKKILEFHGIHARLRPVLPRLLWIFARPRVSGDRRRRREDGSIGIEFNAVVSSIRELMNGSTGSMRTSDLRS